MQCAESLRVQAYFDREVDAISAAEIERHVEHCSACRELLQDLEKVRGALRSGISYATAPPALRAQILQALEDDTDSAATDEATDDAIRGATPLKPRPVRRPRVFSAPGFRIGAFSGIGGAALAAAMVFFLVLPTLSPLSNEIVSAHVRSLMPTHLIDVVSTDKHTVKPWFAGHADVSPAVADFDAQGYRLIGGRADYIDHQRSAVVVYQHGAHVINVFTWAAGGTRSLRNTTRSGYHLAFWQQGDIQYCAVSDTGWDELLGLVRLLREQT